LGSLFDAFHESSSAQAQLPGPEYSLLAAPKKQLGPSPLARLAQPANNRQTALAVGHDSGLPP
jgi:hypothetical protein